MPAHSPKPFSCPRTILSPSLAPRTALSPPRARAELLLQWESGEAQKARRQRGVQGCGVALGGLSWAIPCSPAMSVTAAGLEHRLPCWGFAFREHDRVLGPSLQLLKVSGVCPRPVPCEDA